MNKRSKSINLFLIDGDVKGRIKCTIANWTGLVLKFLEFKLKIAKSRRIKTNRCLLFIWIC